MIGAGDLRHRVRFDSPTQAPDGYGGVEVGWTEEGEARAHFRWLRGGETVQAARLEGRQPVVVTLWASEAARRITPAWRMTDMRTGEVYNIRSVVVAEDEARVELTCERGVAV